MFEFGPCVWVRCAFRLPGSESWNHNPKHEHPSREVRTRMWKSDRGTRILGWRTFSPHLEFWADNEPATRTCAHMWHPGCGNWFPCFSECGYRIRMWNPNVNMGREFGCRVPGQMRVPNSSSEIGTGISVTQPNSKCWFRRRVRVRAPGSQAVFRFARRNA